MYSHLPYPQRPGRRALLSLLAAVLLFAVSGCRLGWVGVDPDLALAARRSVYRQELPRLEEFEEEPREEEEKGGWGDVIVAELLAIFPGILVHGMGHLYAGDRETFSTLSSVGQFGYLLTAVGGGLVTAGHFANEEDLTGLSISLFASGGIVGGAGVGYLLAAWGYDLYDTPRAVLSGGEPPPRTPFVESMDIFKN